MPCIDVPAAYAAFSANGTTDGYAVVTSNADFYPGASAWIWDDDANSGQECIITNLSGTDKIGLRFLNRNASGVGYIGPTYTRNDCSAFTLAKHAKIQQEPSVVRVNMGGTPAKISSV